MAHLVFRLTHKVDGGQPIAKGLPMPRLHWPRLLALALAAALWLSVILILRLF